MKWSIRSAMAFAALLLLSACDMPPADESFIVTTLTDRVDVLPGDGQCIDTAGSCSLRAAVQEANANPNKTEILLPAGSTFTLTRAGAGEDAASTGDLDLHEPTYLRVLGPGTVTIDGNGLDRVIDAHRTFHQLRGVVVTGGSTGDSGGGVQLRSGVIDFEDSRVTDNTAARGGGIFAEGNGYTVIENSTIDDNEATTSYGGGISVLTGRLDLIQSTISGNTSALTGGGVDFESGRVNLDHTTIADNSSGGSGGGLSTFGSFITIGSSVIGDQASGASCFHDSSNPVTSLGFSVDVDNTCELTHGNDSPNGSALLFPLADNGGLHPTHLPAVGSDALNTHGAGLLGCGTAPLDVDQRGVARPMEALCESGAVEASAAEQVGIDCTNPPTVGVGAQLQNCDLSSVNLGGVDLGNANLSGATLPAFLTDTDGAGANLTNADATGSTFCIGDWTNSIIAGMDVTGAQFGSAEICPVDFTGASGTPANAALADWQFVTCPDGMEADFEVPSCVGHFLP